MGQRLQRQPITSKSRPRRVSKNGSGVLGGGAAHAIYIYEKNVNLSKIRQHDHTKIPITQKKNAKKKQYEHTKPQISRTAASRQAYSIMQKKTPPPNLLSSLLRTSGHATPPAATAEATPEEQDNHGQQKTGAAISGGNICSSNLPRLLPIQAERNGPKPRPDRAACRGYHCSLLVHRRPDTEKNVWKSTARIRPDEGRNVFYEGETFWPNCFFLFFPD